MDTEEGSVSDEESGREEDLALVSVGVSDLAEDSGPDSDVQEAPDPVSEAFSPSGLSSAGVEADCRDSIPRV